MVHHMSYEPSTLLKFGAMGAAFFSFSGTPSAGSPLTPAIVGNSSSFTPTISTNDIQLPAGEYIMRFYAGITRTADDRNLRYQWREVGGLLLGKEGATNREITSNVYYISLDSADAYLELTSPGAVQIEMLQADAGITLDANCHAVIWRVP